MGVKDDRKLLASKSILNGDNSLPIGYVCRLAARKYDDESSRPSSRFYTTRKDEQKEEIWVSKAGVRGDYNHYRSIALKGTPDRAVSLLTTDTMELLRSYEYPVADGDLGENMLLDKVCYSFFEPGKQYRFKCSENEVVLEITEPVIPCANLCKLPYINNDSKTPKERIKDCQEFISLLDSKPGLRGWYAKVIKEGAIVPESVLTQVL
jgi:MOSC domain-containing protein YiiM